MGVLLLEFYIVLLAWRLNSTVHPLIDLSAVVASASVKINIQLRLSGFIQLSCWCSVRMKDSILENTSNNVARYLHKQQIQSSLVMKRSHNIGLLFLSCHVFHLETKHSVSLSYDKRLISINFWKRTVLCKKTVTHTKLTPFRIFVATKLRFTNSLRKSCEDVAGLLTMAPPPELAAVHEVNLLLSE